MSKWLFFWIFTAVLYLVPLFFVPSTGLIDDGHSLYITQTLKDQNWEEFTPFLREVEHGRFRPVYSLGTASYALIGGENQKIWVVLHALWLAGLLFLWSKLLTRCGLQEKKAAAVVCLAMLWPSMAANVYRFGTAEVRQSVFLLLALFLLWKERRGGAWSAWALALWSKETTLFTLPLFVFLALARGTWRERILTVASFTTLAIVSYFLIPQQTGYTAGANFSLGTVLHTLFVHIPTAWPETQIGFILAGAGLSMIFGQYVRERKSFADLRNHVTFLGLATSLVIPNVLWHTPLERYFLPAHIFLTVVLVIIAREWKRLYIDRQQSKIWYAAVVVLLFVALPPQKLIKAPFALTARSGREIESWVRAYQDQSKVINVVKKTDETTIIVDTQNEEYAYEVGLYASDFRPNSGQKMIITPFSFPYQNFQQKDNLQKLDQECQNCVVFTDQPSQYLEQGRAVTPLGRNTNWFQVEPKSPHTEL